MRCSCIMGLCSIHPGGTSILIAADVIPVLARVFSLSSLIHLCFTMTSFVTSRTFVGGGASSFGLSG